MALADESKVSVADAGGCEELCQLGRSLYSKQAMVLASKLSAVFGEVCSVEGLIPL
jgi:hypothetical protein